MWPNASTWVQDCGLNQGQGHHSVGQTHLWTCALYIYCIIITITIKDAWYLIVMVTGAWSAGWNDSRRSESGDRWWTKIGNNHQYKLQSSHVTDGCSYISCHQSSVSLLLLLLLLITKTGLMFCQYTIRHMFSVIFLVLISFLLQFFFVSACLQPVIGFMFISL